MDMNLEKMNAKNVKLFKTKDRRVIRLSKCQTINFYEFYSILVNKQFIILYLKETSLLTPTNIIQIQLIHCAKSFIIILYML